MGEWKQPAREVEVNSGPKVGNQTGHRAMGQQKGEDRKRKSRWCREEEETLRGEIEKTSHNNSNLARTEGYGQQGVSGNLIEKKKDIKIPKTMVYINENLT